MRKLLLGAASMLALFYKPEGKPLGRHRTRDVAFPFRMGAGFPGTVNRAHPASIEPCLIDASNPPTAFGQAVVIDSTTEGARPLGAGDTAVTFIHGITVRPYPFQGGGSVGAYASQAFGVGAPVSPGSVDVLTAGYINVVLNTGSASPTKDAPVYVWIAATSGNHIQGGFESASTGGSTIELDANHFQFNGPADATGNVEIRCRL